MTDRPDYLADLYRLMQRIDTDVLNLTAELERLERHVAGLERDVRLAGITHQARIGVNE